MLLVSGPHVLHGCFLVLLDISSNIIQEKKDETVEKLSSNKPMMVAPSTTIEKVSESKLPKEKSIFKTKTPKSKKMSPKEFSEKVEKIVKNS